MAALRSWMLTNEKTLFLFVADLFHAAHLRESSIVGFEECKTPAGHPTGLAGRHGAGRARPGRGWSGGVARARPHISVTCCIRNITSHNITSHHIIARPCICPPTCQKKYPGRQQESWTSSNSIGSRYIERAADKRKGNRILDTDL